jgi:hypothetical protein
VAPWEGPRHRSWAKNTNVAGLFAFVIFVTYAVWEALGTAPQALIGLLGPTVGAWFMASAADDRRERKETKEAADDAKAKAELVEAPAALAEAKAIVAATKAAQVEVTTERLVELATDEHPEVDADALRAPPAHEEEGK